MYIKKMINHCLKPNFKSIKKAIKSKEDANANQSEK